MRADESGNYIETVVGRSDYQKNQIVFTATPSPYSEGLTGVDPPSRPPPSPEKFAQNFLGLFAETLSK